MDKPFLRLAHISDLHFSKPSFGLGQFFSKQWIGNLNFLLSRKRHFLTERLNSLIPVFKELKVNVVVITGDLTTTSVKEEFVIASEFINALKRANMSVFALPGNHDQYTKTAFKQKRFYNYIANSSSQNASGAFYDTEGIYHYTLREHQVSASFLGNNWWMVNLDTAIATSLISSRGYFSPEVEKNLRAVLSLIPPHHQVIVANHFPFFNHDSPRKALGRGDALRQILSQFPNVKLFLHGHTHRHCVADLRPNQLPLLLDSGSTSYKSTGSWNMIDLSHKGCAVQVFNWKDASSSEIPPSAMPWKQVKQHAFTW